MKTRSVALRKPATPAPDGPTTRAPGAGVAESPSARGEARVRLVYASRSRATASNEDRAADVRGILAQAVEHNAGLGITGLLLAANGHYLQVLEGPRVAVEALFERIQKDTRHEDLSILLNCGIEAAIFPVWSMGLVERSEPENVTAERVRALRLRLAEDAGVSPADFFRLMLAPSNIPFVPRTPPNDTGVRAPPRREPIYSVAFASRTGMWSAAVLQHVAAKSMLRLGRTLVTNLAGPARRTLIEYLDTDLPDSVPLRALSLQGEVSDCAPLALLVERMSLLVFMLTPSEFEQFVPYARAWLALPQVLACRPKVLVLAGLPAERLRPVLDDLGRHTGLEITSANLKLSDAAAVWNAVQFALPGRSADHVLAVEPAQAAPASTNDAFVSPHVSAPDTVATQEAPDPWVLSSVFGEHFATQPAPLSVQGDDAPQADRLAHMLADSGCLQELLGLEGALYAAVLDTGEPRPILCAPESDEVVQASFDDAMLLRAKCRLVRSLDADEIVEDIVLTTALLQKVFRPLRKQPSLFLAVTLKHGGVGLAAVRIKLHDVASALDLLAV